MKNDDNVVEVFFGKACLDDMLNDLRDVVANYGERISGVEALGIVEYLKLEIYNEVFGGE